MFPWRVWGALGLLLVGGCGEDSSGSPSGSGGAAGGGAGGTSASGGQGAGGAGGAAAGSGGSVASGGAGGGGGGATTCGFLPTQGGAGYLSILPGRRGFGMATSAGSGRGQGASTLHRVTHLGTSGAGSLRACVEASGPRVCVFEVSGTIEGDGSLEIRNPYLTIAGQTAPSPGVTLKNTTLAILNTHDVLIQHLRIRVGDDPNGEDPSNRDALTIGAFPPVAESSNIVIDHVSLGWSIDEIMSTWADTGKLHDIAVVDSIFSEALRCSLHPEGCHSTGLLFGRHTQRAMVVGSLFAHNDWRNPLLRDAFDSIVVANNVVFADGDIGVQVQDNCVSDCSGGASEGPAHADVIGNALFFQTARVGQSGSTFSTGSSFYFGDNRCEAGVGDVCVTSQGVGASFVAPAPGVSVEGFLPQASALVESGVLAYAGARPADRDAVDQRVVAEVSARTKHLIDSPSQVGGHPQLAENHQTFGDPQNPDEVPATDPATGGANPGYTRRELHLQALARAVECGAGK
ncbi:MAG: hypothetical protein U0263_02570 [Polyangiaceae bacterium]